MLEHPDAQPSHHVLSSHLGSALQLGTFVPFALPVCMGYGNLPYLSNGQHSRLIPSHGLLRWIAPYLPLDCSATVRSFPSIQAPHRFVFLVSLSLSFLPTVPMLPVQPIPSVVPTHASNSNVPSALPRPPVYLWYLHVLHSYAICSLCALGDHFCPIVHTAVARENRRRRRLSNRRRLFNIQGYILYSSSLYVTSSIWCKACSVRASRIYSSLFFSAVPKIVLCRRYTQRPIYCS